MKQDVKQVCVLGMPDPVWGEQVTACIVLKEGSKLTEDDIVAWCKQHIASYKKPRKVISFHSFLKTPMARFQGSC